MASNDVSFFFFILPFVCCCDGDEGDACVYKENISYSFDVLLKFAIMSKEHSQEEFEETPTWAAVVTVLGYAILNALGWLRDFLRNIGFEEKKTAQDPNSKVGHYSFDNCDKFFSLGFRSTL